jgi:hypothetical protein
MEAEPVGEDSEFEEPIGGKKRANKRTAARGNK